MHFVSAKFFPLTALLAEFAMSVFDEFGIGIAIVLTVAGMAMHWRLPRQRMSIEESVKDGKLTEEAAQRRLRIYGWCAPTATLLGVGVLVAALINLMA